MICLSKINIDYLGMLYCLKKRAIIFWVGKDDPIMVYTPEHLPDGEIDSEIPLLGVYNGFHYQVWEECYVIIMIIITVINTHLFMLILKIMVSAFYRFLCSVHLYLMLLVF